MKNEGGSVFVETILAICVAFLFLGGTLEIHRSWKKRHRAILEHRNEAIRALRVEKAELLPAIRIPGLDRLRRFISAD